MYIYIIKKYIFLIHILKIKNKQNYSKIYI